MLSEGVGPQTWIAMLLGTGRNLRPVRYTFLGLSLLRGTGRNLRPYSSALFDRELKCEIGREAFFIPLYLLIQTLRANAINTSQVCVEDDLLFADLVNQIFQTNDRCDDFFFTHTQIVLGSYRMMHFRKMRPRTTCLELRGVHVAAQLVASKPEF